MSAGHHIWLLRGVGAAALALAWAMWFTARHWRRLYEQAEGLNTAAVAEIRRLQRLINQRDNAEWS